MLTVSSQGSDLSLNLLTLSFREELEREFMKDYRKKSLGHVRAALLIAIFFYSVFGILDGLLVPAYKESLWFIRYAVFTPYVLGVFLFSFTRFFLPIMQPMLASVILLAGLGIVAMIVIAPFPVSYSYYAGLILVFIYGYTFFKLRFIWASAAGWLIVCAYEYGALYLAQSPLSGLISSNFFFLAGNFLGMCACYCNEFYARRDFVRARELEEGRKQARVANRELEKRVEERTAQVLAANKDLREEIEERKVAQIALKQSEQRFKSLSENSPQIIYTLASDGSFAYVNPAWEKVLGHRVDEVMGRFFVDFAPPEDRDLYVKLFKRIRDGKETLEDVTGILYHRDGTKRVFSMYGAPNFDPDGRVVGMVGIIIDITEQKRLQAQLQQAQKMEAVGTLAGGVAHDFNNLLQAVQGYADLLLLRMRREERGYREIQQIKHSAQRGAELTQQLLTFSRKVESKLRPTDLNHEVRQVHKLLQRTIPKMVNISLHLEEGLATINSDPAQMEQILMNMSVNAKDAMPEGGDLVIRTRNETLDEAFCRKHPGAKPGKYVCLEVSDTGHGIEGDKLDKIFEPFFTTKERGRGTGLGLAMVYGIVKSHDGYVTCHSKVGNGTTFRIYLPVLDAVCVQEGEGETAPAPVGGTETILLVDDESHIRDLGSRILSHFGYEVLTAPDGESALSTIRNRLDSVDLYVVDLIMPGMGGMRFVDELRKIRPEAKVLISSGHVVEDTMKRDIEDGKLAFVKKPWDVDEILQAVRNVLEHPSSSAAR